MSSLLRRGRLHLGFGAPLAMLGLLSAAGVMDKDADLGREPTTTLPATTLQSRTAPLTPPVGETQAVGYDRLALLDRPPTPNRRAYADWVEERLERLGDHHDPAILENPTQMAADLLSAAEQLGDARLIAKAVAVAASVDYELATDLEAEARAGQRAAHAFELAVAANDHAGAARAAAMSAGFEVDDERAARWARTAELHIQLAGGSPRAELGLLRFEMFRAQDREDYEEAGSIARHLIKLSNEVYGPTHPTTGADYSMLATVEELRGDLDAAEDAARRSLEILLQTQAANAGEVLSIRTDLGSILFVQGRHAEAGHQFDVIASHLGDTSGISPATRFRFQTAHLTIGRTLAILGHFEPALEHFEAIVDLIPAEDPWSSVVAHREVAKCQLAMGNRSAAIESLHAALRYTDATAAESPERAEVRAKLAELEAR